MSQIDVSVIVPCFNESANLGELAQRLLNTFQKFHISGEIVLVDDASTDDSLEVMKALEQQYDCLRFESHKVNRGMEGGWRTGLELSRGKYACFLDGDLQYLPEDVGRLYREILVSRVDVVQGYRSSIGRLKDSRFILSKGLNTILNLLFGMKARDNKSGFVMARRETLLDMLDHRYSYYYFQSFITVSAKAKGYTIREIETLFESRLLGKSFIPSFPFALVCKCFADVAKGFFEFRVFRKQETTLARFLRSENPTLPQKTGEQALPFIRLLLWRFFWLTVPFHKWLITRRARLYYQELSKSQWLSRDKIRELQELKLRKLILHAYYHVEYYRDLFDREGISPESIQSLDDLSKVPLLSKVDVRDNLHFGLLSDNHSKRRILKITTSGSTGEPFTCYADQHQLEIRWASTLRSMEWTGYQFGDAQTRLWHQTLGMSWLQVFREKVDAYLSRRHFVPAFEMSDANITNTMREISNHCPVILDGYAESFNLLASYIERKKKALPKLPQLKGILSSAQELPEQSREIIESAFGCRVFDKYGSREFSGIAYECDAHSGHHIIAENFVVEILKEGKPAKPGELGEVVITDLNNFCMPFIRYRIGDLAVALDNSETCSCGRGLPRIGKIVGRTQAIIVGSNGRYLPGTFFSHFFKDYEYLVRKYQVIQEKKGEIILKVIKASRFQQDAFHALLDELKEYLGRETVIHLDFVEDIPLVRTGKHQGSISHLQIDFQELEHEAVKQPQFNRRV